MKCYKQKYFLMQSLFLLVLITESCNQHRLNGIDGVIQKYSVYPKDSLKLICALFLKKNMSDLESNKLVFINNKTKREVDIRLDTIGNVKSLEAILKNQNLSFKSKNLPDSIVLESEQIERDIDHAIDDWKKYPWNKTVPIDVFLNYLLPYKVFDEYPEKWRDYFVNKFKDSIVKSIQTYRSEPIGKDHKITDRLYYDIIVGNVGKWFTYNPEYKKLSNTPSLSEMMCINEGDCFNWSYLNIYVLRSFGIPSALDIVPLWGSKNGGHASEVFFHEDGRIAPARGREFERPAKVIRISFKRQNIWSDSIKPLTHGGEFLLPFLQHDHWYDVTSQHTMTVDVTCLIPGLEGKLPFAYICVFNYGEWQPIFYGKVENNGNVLFKNMGCDMLYRLALPSNNGIGLTNDFFVIDSLGLRHELSNTRGRPIQMTLKKINRGTDAYVRKNKFYELLMLDDKKQWTSLGSKICLNDSSVVFDYVPENGFFRLMEINRTDKVERIFNYVNGKQKWW